MHSPPNSKFGSTHQAASRSPSSRWHRRLSHSTRPSKAPSPKVVLGNDAIASLPTELNKLCLSLPLVVYSLSRLSLANRIRALLPNLDACFQSSDTHPLSAMMPGRDSVISVGGPRAVALARRISLKMGIPHICIPTTHSGAAGDLSPPWGHMEEDDAGSKTFEEDGDVRSDHDDKSLPAVILYDKKLTESRIRRFSVPSGEWDDTETEAELDAAIPFARSAATGADASILRSKKSGTSQWSYLDLPGV